MSASGRDIGVSQEAAVDVDSAGNVPRVIVVMTDCRFTGDLLCAYVETECHYPCTVALALGHLAIGGDSPRPERIALID